MKKIKIKDEYIKLGQAMKLANMVSSGADAKVFIQNGEVFVNGEICMMRGKKLYKGDKFKYNDEIVEIE